VSVQNDERDASIVKLFRAKPDVYVSEPDLQAALNHLRALQFSAADSRPRAWDRQQLIVTLKGIVRDASFLKLNVALPIGPGLLAVCKPLGCDLLRMPRKPRGLQVWLYIRSVGTDPNELSKL
jgi:hypothetical protein